MRKRRFYLGLGLLVVAIGVIVMLVSLEREPVVRPEREPEYAGKKLSEWLQKYGEENSPSEGTLSPVMAYPSPRLNGEADDAIRHIGTNAIPCLLVWIRCEDWYRDRRARIRSYGAVGGFSSLGPRAAGAIGELSNILNRSTSAASRGRAADALAFIGKDAIPVLVAVLTNQQAASLRGSVIRSMAAMDTNARPAIPILLRCLDDNDGDVAANAALTLGTLGIEPSLVIPALVNKLQMGRGWSRDFVTFGLLRFGTEARLAVPALIRLLHDPDESTRRLATNALRKIDPDALEKATAQ